MKAGGGDDCWVFLSGCPRVLGWNTRSISWFHAIGRPFYVILRIAQHNTRARKSVRYTVKMEMH